MSNSKYLKPKLQTKVVCVCSVQIKPWTLAWKAQMHGWNIKIRMKVAFAHDYLTVLQSVGTLYSVTLQTQIYLLVF